MTLSSALDSFERAFAWLLASVRCLWREHEPLRMLDEYPALHERFEGVVRISALEADGAWFTKIVAGTERHPRRIMRREPATVGAVPVGAVPVGA